MTYVYLADIWCDSCGEKLVEDVPKPGYPPPWDSDDYPAACGDPGPSDSPQHCAAGGDCIGEYVDLREWGLEKGDRLYGAETVRIGELVSDELTEEGARNVREMLAEPSRTPYQSALHSFWRVVFADSLD